VINTDSIIAAEGEYCDEWENVTELASVGAFYPISIFNITTTVFMTATGEVYDSILDNVAEDFVDMQLAGCSGEQFLDLSLSPDTNEIKK